MSAHTPGPWSLTENTKRTLNGSWFEINGQMTRIANVPASTNAMWDFVPGYQTGLANARLIAAAPDLLAALEKAASHIEAMMAHIEGKPERFKSHCWQQALDARAAIARATGAAS